MSLKHSSAGDRRLRGRLFDSEHFENHCQLFSDSHCCFWDSMSVPCLCFHCAFCSEDALLSVLLGRHFTLVLTNLAPFSPDIAFLAHSPFSFGTLDRYSLSWGLSVLTKTFCSLLPSLTPSNCKVAPSVKHYFSLSHMCPILFIAHIHLCTGDARLWAWLSWELQAVFPHAAAYLCCTCIILIIPQPTLPLPSLGLTFHVCFHSKILTPLSLLFTPSDHSNDWQRAVPKLPT